MNERGTWDDIRRLIDELELKMHLAGMELRERWQQLQPALRRLEQTLERGGKIVADEVEAVGKSLKEMRDELADAVDNKSVTPP